MIATKKVEVDRTALGLLQHNLFIMAAVFIMWGALFFNEINSVVAIWLSSDTYAHGLFILPLAGWLVWRKKSKFMAIAPKVSYIAAACCVAIALLWLIAQLMEINSLIHLFSFMMLSSLLWMFLGNEFAKVFKFPLVFILFCAPFGNSLIPYLQVITAEITVFMLQLSQIPVFYEGLYITVPSGVFEVAVACSGIRYLIACLAIGSIYAHLSYASLRKQIVFMLFAIIFPIIANGIRAYLIVIIAYLSDMKYATGVDHLIYGWLFFGLVIYLLFYIGSFWADKPVADTVNERVKQQTSLSVKKSVVTVISIAILCVIVIKTRSIVAIDVPQQPHALTVPSIDDSPMNHDAWGIDFKHAQALHRGRDSTGVEVYLAKYGHRQRIGKLITSVNRLYEVERWSLVTSMQRNISADQQNVNYHQLSLVNSNGEQRIVRYWYMVDGLYLSSRLATKIEQALALVWGNSDVGYLVAISTTIDEASDDEVLANSALDDWINNNISKLQAQLK